MGLGLVKVNQRNGDDAVDENLLTTSISSANRSLAETLRIPSPWIALFLPTVPIMITSMVSLVLTLPLLHSSPPPSPALAQASRSARRIDSAVVFDPSPPGEPGRQKRSL